MADSLGLKKNARNPGSIINEQHHDASNAQKNLGGSPGQIKSIIPASTTVTAIEDESVLRVVNTSGADQFIFIGKVDEVPGVLSASNALVIHGQTTEIFFSGSSDNDSKSLAVKTSNNAVQVAIMK